MRFAIASLILALMITVAAAAESGHQADFDTIVDMGAMMSSLGSMLPPEGMPPGEALPADALGPIELSGKIYWTDNYVRLDYDPTEEMHESTLVDINNQVTYKLDHLTKTATRIELQELSAELAHGFDIPDPETMATDWETFISSLQQMDSATVAELAPRQINGYNASGVSFSVDMSQAFPMPKEGELEGDEAGMAEMLSAVMSAMGGYSGEIWVTEGIDMPIAMSLNTAMMEYSWSVANVAAFSAEPSFFKVPAGYEVVEMELPDFSSMPDLSRPQGPRPAPPTT